MEYKNGIIFKMGTKSILQCMAALPDKITELPKQECVFCHQDAHKPVCAVCLSVLEEFVSEDQELFVNCRPDIRKHIACLADFPMLAIGPHKGLLMDLINQFKYGKKLFLAPVLAGLMQHKVAMAYQHIPLPQAILPVPMHPLKRMFRGFNQTEEVVLRIDAADEFQIYDTWLDRARYFTPQAGKTGNQRRKLKTSPFRIRDAIALENLCHIALFDDVITTGTTLSHLIRDIRKVNPDIRIDLWCLSVSLPH